MLMTLAYELGKTLEEVSCMSLEEIYQWMAFFKVRHEEQEKMRRQAESKFGKGKSRRPGSDSFW